MSPTFYFQKIYDVNKRVKGIEVLTRKYPVNRNTDLYIFSKILKLLDKVDFEVPVYVNLFVDTLPYIDWDRILKTFSKKKLVIEVIEDGVWEKRKLIFNLIENGIVFALDDFGTGSSNFSILKEVPFPIVKIDATVVPSKVAEILKEEFQIPTLVAEKCHDFSYPVDFFQSYKLHYPEEI